MNERIRELVVESGNGLMRDGKLYPHIGSRTEADWKKFAELIVRECAEFMDENSGYDDCNNAWHPEPEELLKHFGVEE